MAALQIAMPTAFRMQFASHKETGYAFKFGKFTFFYLGILLAKSDWARFGIICVSPGETEVRSVKKAKKT